MHGSNSQQRPSAAGHPQTAGLEAVPISYRNQFFINHRSEMDGKLYEGQFTSRKLTIRDIGQLGVRKSQLNGGFYYDETRPGVGIGEDIDGVNGMIAHLELALVQSPIWFDLDNMYDIDLLALIYKKVVEFENNFFRSVRDSNGDLGRSQNDSGAEGTQSGSVRSVAAVGGGQVQAALDP